MPALISLDLSFNPVSLAGANLTPLAGLIRLELSGCDLTNLTGDDDDDDDDEDSDEEKVEGGSGGEGSPLRPLTSLVELNLSDNDISSLAALVPLKQLPALRDVDLSENDVRDVRGYKKSMLEMLPKLARLDGDGTGQGKILQMSKNISLYGDDSDSGAATVFGANVDRSSCSCVEGNPCVEPTLCLDWKGRYTVAMNARRKKGYFGEEGTNVQYNLF